MKHFNQRNAFLGIVILLFGFSVIYQLGCTPKNAPNEETELEKLAQTDYKGFPDFGRMLSPKDFDTQFPNQSVFKLRQDYPSTMPSNSEIPKFFEIPFDKKDKWKDWIMAVRDYCFDGMIDVDFVAQKNKTHDWYHMPWLHWGNLASEGFHGLAKEASVSPYQLQVSQKDTGQVYALGFYNNFAGNVLHKMWKNPTAPNAYATQGPKGGFPHGTVIFKLLFTDLDSTDVSYLKNPFVWNAYVTPTWNGGVDNGRIVKKMNLIQMDLMVRDTTADKYGTGWVFGTFCYNGDINNGKSMKERVKNLVPVGIQFGNDPNNTENFINPYPVSKTIINANLKETFINPSADLPPQHLGWGGRLDGPVDLNTASCMSCHSTGEFPQIASLVPAQSFIGTTNKYGALDSLTETNAPAFKKYFSNIRCGTAYDPKLATSTDFSLQVSLALQYFWQWRNSEIGGYYFSEYERVARQVNRGGGFKIKSVGKK